MSSRERVGSDASDGAAAISKDTIVEAIQNPRRRYALYYLHKHSGWVDLEDVVLQVAAWERCRTPGEVTASQRRSVYTSLYQTHLPSLAGDRLVEFDKRRNKIRGLLDSENFDLVLANDSRTSTATDGVCLLTTVASVALLALAWHDLTTVGRLPALFVAGTVVLLFSLSTLVHWYDWYRWQLRTREMPPDFSVIRTDDAGRN